MCEIYFQKAEDKGTLDNSQFEQLLDSAVDGARLNPDGYGIFDNRGRIMKSEMPFKSGDAGNVYDHFKNSQFVVLHLRSATHGTVNYSNTHPFKAGNYFLVHNGILHYQTNGDYTDSEKLLHSIVSKGHTAISDKIASAMGEIRGSVSCFLYNSNVHKLYYWRNGSKFTFAYDPGSNQLFGATREIRLRNALGGKQLGYFNTLPNRITLEKPEPDDILRIGQNINWAGHFSQPSAVIRRKTYKTRARRKNSKYNWTGRNESKTKNERSGILDYDPDEDWKKYQPLEVENEKHKIDEK